MIVSWIECRGDEDVSECEVGRFLVWVIKWWYLLLILENNLEYIKFEIVVRFLSGDV